MTTIKIVENKVLVIPLELQSFFCVIMLDKHMHASRKCGTNIRSLLLTLIKTLPPVFEVMHKGVYHAPPY